MPNMIFSRFIMHGPRPECGEGQTGMRLPFNWNSAFGRLLKREMRRGMSILDLGCGIRPFAGISFPNPSLHVDVFAPYLEAAAKMHFPTLKLDISKSLGNYFIPRSYDIVLLLDVVEHLEKDSAMSLIAEAKHISREKVIIYTPDGFLPQEGDAWGLGGSEYQKHRSGFTKGELAGLGFKCETIHVRADGQHPTHDAVFAVWTPR